MGVGDGVVRSRRVRGSDDGRKKPFGSDEEVGDISNGYHMTA